MNKPHQHVADMFETARKCHQAGIRTTFNLILGFPGETDEERRITLEVMGEIASRFDNVTFSPNIFTPYPGIPIWRELRALGMREPRNLREWASVTLGANNLPWLTGDAYRKIRRSMIYFTLNSEIAKAARKPSARQVTRLVLRMIMKPLNWRMKHHYFKMPIELWLMQTRRRLAVRRSLLTGQALGHSLGETG
jgi:anaerobic magnesium-protoporphyrin IX monomethyl ester cyclase